MVQVKVDQTDNLFLKIPEHLRPGLIRYMEDHIEPGSFLRGVLENDLLMALYAADPVNRRGGLLDVVSWLFNKAPIDAWGSVENVRDWLKEI